MAVSADRKDRLLEAGLALASELSLQTVLERITELAVELTDARYGALGVIGRDGRLVQFITKGISERQRRAVGTPPEGRGLLGALATQDRPLRVADIASDPRSVGFPAGHPPMRSFLGAPVKALGKVYGNIYLTEKRDADEFDDDDQAAIEVLAAQAGVAIANAWLYEDARRRETWLEALAEVSTTILAGTETDAALSLVARRARELVAADVAVILIPQESTGSLIALVGDGAGAEALVGRRVELGDSIAGRVIRSSTPLVIDDLGAAAPAYRGIIRRARLKSAVFVPLKRRDLAFGVMAIGNRPGRPTFDEDDLRLLQTFADQAAVALEYGRAQVELRRLAVMDDRERIAKELHDGIIQSIFAVGMNLQGIGAGSGGEIERRIEACADELDRVIQDLRNYIFGLQPGILAERRLDEALRHLGRDFELRSGVVTSVTVDPEVAGRLADRAADIVQLTREALSNVSRHAQAGRVAVGLGRHRDAAVLTVVDDGVGFDIDRTGSGHGLRNLRDRAMEMHGAARIRSTPGRGTSIRVSLPLD